MEEDLDKLCLHFMRQHETLFIEIYQKFSSQSGEPVRCDLCPELTSSPLHNLQHLNHILKLRLKYYFILKFINICY